jgi:cytochrome c oxidase assembly protein subunit 15
MKLAAIVGLLLVMALVSLSSYLRLDHSGIGCTPWPDCYGNIGTETEKPDIASAYERLVAEARQPMSWARPTHRLIASVLGLLVIGIVGLSLQSKQHRLLSFALLGLTVFLAWLGIYSEGLHSPAVVMGNLTGGFAMLGLFGWLVFTNFRDRELISGDSPLNSNRWVMAAIVLLCLQILLGGLTSANFAASACQTLPHCHGMWLPGTEIVSAFDLSRSIEVNDEGFVTGGSERAAIHLLHRIVALITATVVLIAGALAISKDEGQRAVGIFVGAVVVTEFLVGVASVQTNVPIAIAVSHNWLAGLLLLGLLKLRAA